MKSWALIGLSLMVLGIGATNAQPVPVSADGGELTLHLYGSQLRDLGITLEGPSKRSGRQRVLVLPVGRQGSLEFLSVTGSFDRLTGGSLPLTGSHRLIWSNGAQSLDQLRLHPGANARHSLQLADAHQQGWLLLDYGHFEWEGEELHARHLDLRVGPALAEALGVPEIAGELLGAAGLTTQVALPPEWAGGITDNCPVPDPNWPTRPGFKADIAMLQMDRVNQVERVNDRVAFAPSAYFENIGSADVPWFSQFADAQVGTPFEDDCCADQGDGSCAPYGNDQGGILVYAFYRLLDGRLEQLGASGAKHAFNSVNFDTEIGSLECRAIRGGRVVPSGCEDLYQVNTNADLRFLGPREEILAHEGIWLRSGSIWDQDADGECDDPSHGNAFGGQVPCDPGTEDPLQYRLHVGEEEMRTPGARYFIEAWYVVRDDIDIFNSMGHKEVQPVESLTWQFPEVGPFQQGPVVDRLPELLIRSDRFRQADLDTEEGHLRLQTNVRRVAPGAYEYDFTLMNLDYDPAVSEFRLPTAPGARILAASFRDGDGNVGNDWSVRIAHDAVTWVAPAGADLRWGRLVSFRLRAQGLPLAGTGQLAVARPTNAADLQVTVLVPGQPVRFGGTAIE